MFNPSNFWGAVHLGTGLIFFLTRIRIGASPDCPGTDTDGARIGRIFLAAPVSRFTELNLFELPSKSFYLKTFGGQFVLLDNFSKTPFLCQVYAACPVFMPVFFKFTDFHVRLSQLFRLLHRSSQCINYRAAHTLFLQNAYSLYGRAAG